MSVGSFYGPAVLNYESAIFYHGLLAKKVAKIPKSIWISLVAFKKPIETPVISEYSMFYAAEGVSPKTIIKKSPKEY